jgi:hypothetical protein
MRRSKDQNNVCAACCESRRNLNTQKGSKAKQIAVQQPTTKELALSLGNYFPPVQNVSKRNKPRIPTNQPLDMCLVHKEYLPDIASLQKNCTTSKNVKNTSSPIGLKTGNKYERISGSGSDQCKFLTRRKDHPHCPKCGTNLNKMNYDVSSLSPALGVNY